jgi:hypothetical protein
MSHLPLGKLMMKYYPSSSVFTAISVPKTLTVAPMTGCPVAASITVPDILPLTPARACDDTKNASKVDKMTGVIFSLVCKVTPPPK